MENIILLGLPTRLTNLLYSEEINTIDKLISFTPQQLINIPNMGIKSIKFIEESLLKFGYVLPKSNGEI